VFLDVLIEPKHSLSRCPRIESKGPPSEQKTKALELQNLLGGQLSTMQV